MSNSEENRLDRLESLAENTLTELREIKSGLQEIRLGLQETNQGLKETTAIANSNVKLIEALTNSLAQSKKEWEKDRQGLDQLLGQLTRSMSDFYEVQSDFYNRFNNEERESRMVEILERYFPPRKSCQFLAEIAKKLITDGGLRQIDKLIIKSNNLSLPNPPYLTISYLF